MPRKRKPANSTTPAEAVTTPVTTALPPAAEEAPLTEHGDDMLPPPDACEMPETGQHSQPPTTAAGPIHAADPRPVMSVNLCGYSGGPAVHLLRSHRFKQMQVLFEQGQPDERYLAMLKRDGWIDRRESEGVWTKQIDPNARWQSVDRMEKEFKAMANAIRKDKGLEPVLERLALA